MNSSANEDLGEIGRTDEGGSRRTLAPETARRMVAVREAPKAYRRFHTSCFWSYPPDLEIGMNEVEWVAEQLMKHGDREAWLIGKSLGPCPHARSRRAELPRLTLAAVEALQTAVWAERQRLSQCLLGAAGTASSATYAQEPATSRLPPRG